ARLLFAELPGSGTERRERNTRLEVLAVLGRGVLEWKHFGRAGLDVRQNHRAEHGDLVAVHKRPLAKALRVVDGLNPLSGRRIFGRDLIRVVNDAGDALDLEHQHLAATQPHDEVWFIT